MAVRPRRKPRGMVAAPVEAEGRAAPEDWKLGDGQSATVQSQGSVQGIDRAWLVGAIEPVVDDRQALRCELNPELVLATADR